MNEVNKTLFIPLYGKALVSKKNIILKDPWAEKIWEAEQFPIKGKSKSKWLAYNMSMRARIFDDWTKKKLEENKKALVLHFGCGLDSRHERVKGDYLEWIDADFSDVIAKRKAYYKEEAHYHMKVVDLSKPDALASLPSAETVIVILEGVSMYLRSEELRIFFSVLQKKYQKVHLLMDVYTRFAAKLSKYKNPVNDVGVTTLYGIDDPRGLALETNFRVKEEHSLTPSYLVSELGGFDRIFFKVMFNHRMMKKFYRLFEFETV